MGGRGKNPETGSDPQFLMSQRLAIGLPPHSLTGSPPTSHIRSQLRIARLMWPAESVCRTLRRIAPAHELLAKEPDQEHGEGHANAKPNRRQAKDIRTTQACKARV